MLNQIRCIYRHLYKIIIISLILSVLVLLLDVNFMLENSFLFVNLNFYHNQDTYSCLYSSAKGMSTLTSPYFNPVRFWNSSILYCAM